MAYSRTKALRTLPISSNLSAAGFCDIHTIHRVIHKVIVGAEKPILFKSPPHVVADGARYAT